MSNNLTPDKNSDWLHDNEFLSMNYFLLKVTQMVEHGNDILYDIPLSTLLFRVTF